MLKNEQADEQIARKGLQMQEVCRGGFPLRMFLQSPAILCYTLTCAVNMAAVS